MLLLLHACSFTHVGSPLMLMGTSRDWSDAIPKKATLISGLNLFLMKISDPKRQGRILGCLEQKRVSQPSLGSPRILWAPKNVVWGLWLHVGVTLCSIKDDWKF